MAQEVLSQSEIDMLLNALTAGEIDTEEIKREAQEVKTKIYDFRRPNKFSKDHMRTIHMIHENFARLVSNFLSAYLRTNIEVKIASVDQITFEDFIVSIPSPTVMTIFNMKPLLGSAVLETNPAFTFPIIDLLFGGPGEMPKKSREITDIEANVLKNIYGKMLENLTYVWSEVNEITTAIQGLETNPQMNRVISPNEIVAVITFMTTIGDYEGMINLCLPYLMLEPITLKLSSRYWFSSPEKGMKDQKQTVMESLEQTPIKLTAIGGETELTIKEFLALQLGDVLTLDNKVAEDLILLVEDKPKYTVQPGIYERKMAVQITGYWERGEKTYE
ncbi:MAG: flagellar motor switch protein FliM [Bacillota bacterium]